MILEGKKINFLRDSIMIGSVRIAAENETQGDTFCGASHMQMLLLIAKYIGISIPSLYGFIEDAINILSDCVAVLRKVTHYYASA